MEPIPPGPAILIELILLALTAYISLLKTVAESLSENKLERLVEEGNPKASQVLSALPRYEDAEDAMETALSFMLFTDGLAAYALFAPRLTSLVPFFASGLPGRFLLLLLLGVAGVFIAQLLGVVLPRRLAAPKSDELVVSQFGSLQRMTHVARPLTRLITACVNGLLKLFGADPAKAVEQVTEDEILAMVDIGEEKGAIESNEKELIENLFEFNNPTAEDCMTHRTNVYAIDINSTDEEIMKLLQESGRSRFPVYEENIDNVLGTITTREYLLNRVSEHPKPLCELLRPAYFVPETVRTDMLFREMQRRKNHIAIVVDEYGGTSGLITMEDLLEQIVGNIFDEFDPAAEQDIAALPDGSWRVSGACDLETLCETLHIDPISDEEYDTVGGLVFSQLTAIPDDGSHPEVQCFGLSIRVESLQDRHVEWAIVRKLEPGGESKE